MSSTMSNEGKRESEIHEKITTFKINIRSHERIIIIATVHIILWSLESAYL